MMRITQFPVFMMLCMTVACTSPGPVGNDHSEKDTTAQQDLVTMVHTDTVGTTEEIPSGVPDYLVNDNPPYEHTGKEEDRMYGVDYEGDSVIYTEGKKILMEGEVEGEFVEIQAGDYLHLTLKDKKGWFHHFWVMMDNERLMDYFWQGYEFRRGQKLRVYWKRKKETLPESGGPIVLYEMVDFKILDK